MNNAPDLSNLFEMLNSKGIDMNELMQNFSNMNSNNFENSAANENSINKLHNHNCGNPESSNTPGNNNSNYITESNKTIDNNSFNLGQSKNFAKNNFKSDCNTSNQAEDSKDGNNNSNTGMPDIETMMKIAKIMSKINSNTNSPSAELLYSLKPFLRDSKKEKIDQYIKFLKMSSVISELNKPGGDFK